MATKRGARIRGCAVLTMSFATPALASPASLTWNNHSGTNIWNTTDANWFNGTTSVPYSDKSNGSTGDAVLFNDSNGVNYTGDNISVAGAFSPTSVTFNNSYTDYTLGGPGGVGGSTSVVKLGSATTTLAGSDNYSAGTFVDAGTLAIGSGTAFPVNTNLTIASGARMELTFASYTAYAPVVSSLANTGSIDVENNGLVLENTPLSVASAQVTLGYNHGNWNGFNATTGTINSSVAANDAHHLTAVGVATELTSFLGSTVSPSDVLVRYTICGDTDLDFDITSADYARIDNGYKNHLTGWANGDFNYDGVVNYEDYALADAACDIADGGQSDALAHYEIPLHAYEFGQPYVTALLALDPTAPIPEPNALAFLTFGAIAALRRTARYGRF